VKRETLPEFTETLVELYDYCRERAGWEIEPTAYEEGRPNQFLRWQTVLGEWLN